jgi:hypothetical protein
MTAGDANLYGTVHGGVTAAHGRKVQVRPTYRSAPARR